MCYYNKKKIFVSLNHESPMSVSQQPFEYFNGTHYSYFDYNFYHILQPNFKWPQLSITLFKIYHNKTILNPNNLFSC